MPPFGGCGVSLNTQWLLQANSDVNLILTGVSVSPSGSKECGSPSSLLTTRAQLTRTNSCLFGSQTLARTTSSSQGLPTWPSESRQQDSGSEPWQRHREKDRNKNFWQRGDVEVKRRSDGFQASTKLSHPRQWGSAFSTSWHWVLSGCRRMAFLRALRRGSLALWSTSTSL